MKIIKRRLRCSNVFPFQEQFHSGFLVHRCTLKKQIAYGEFPKINRIGNKSIFWYWDQWTKKLYYKTVNILKKLLLVSLSSWNTIYWEISIIYPIREINKLNSRKIYSGKYLSLVIYFYVTSKAIKLLADKIFLYRQITSVLLKLT